MGTRNLTCVVFDNKIQVAQYGQWDGYPDGQGVGIIEIMRIPENRKWLEEGLEYIEMADFNNLIEGTPAHAAVTAYDNACPDHFATPPREEDKRTPAQLNWHKTFLSRDLGSEILENIITLALKIASVTDGLDAETARARREEFMFENYGFREKIILNDSTAFAADSLFCEWAYVIDLDKGQLEVYRGFNTTRQLEPQHRFFFLQSPDGKPVDGYYPIYLIATFDLLQLPDNKEFVRMVEEKDGQIFPEESTTEQLSALVNTLQERVE